MARVQVPKEGLGASKLVVSRVRVAKGKARAKLKATRASRVGSLREARGSLARVGLGLGRRVEHALCVARKVTGVVSVLTGRPSLLGQGASLGSSD